MTPLFRLPALAVLACLAEAGTSSLAASPSASPAPSAAFVPSAPAVPPDAPVAWHGDLKLTAEDLRLLVQRADPALRVQLLANPAALKEFVRERMLRLLMLEKARAVGFDQKPEVVRRANEARDTVIVSAYIASLTEPDPAYPSQADIVAAYENNKARFAMPRQYQVSQIAVRLPVGSSAKEDEEAKAKILSIRQQLNRKNADFAALARQYSDDHVTGHKGGDLGWVREDQLVPAVRDAVSTMPDDTISEPIRTPEGWHIIKLTGSRPASVAPLADVQEEIAQALRQRRVQQNTRIFVDDMLRKEPIELNENELARSVARPR